MDGFHQLMCFLLPQHLPGTDVVGSPGEVMAALLWRGALLRSGGRTQAGMDLCPVEAYAHTRH